MPPTAVLERQPRNVARKLPVVLACLAVLAGVGYGVIYPQLAALYHWRQARQALAQCDFRAARGHLGPCLEAWPTSGETHFALARACRRDGDLDAARAELQEAERFGWVQPLVELEGLLIQAQSGLVPRVEPALRALLAEGHRDETLILEALVRGCLQSNYPRDGHRWSTIWVERHPDDWQGLYWRGRVLEEALQNEQAAGAYRQSLEKHGGFADTHFHLAEVLQPQGRFAEAQEHYRTFLAGRPDHPAALVGLARCLRSLNALDEAKAALGRLFAAVPDHVAGCVLLAQMLLDEDKPDEALRWLRRAERQDPLDRLTNKTLAKTLRWLKQDDAAQAYEQKNRQMDQDYQRVDRLILDILAHPDDVALRCEAGTTLLRLGRVEQAFRWLVGAYLRDPACEETRQALAACIRQLGDPRLEASYRSVLAGGSGR